VTTLAVARSILQRLAEAVPDTWRQDRVFRGAVIGADVTLAVLVVRPGATHQARQLPPLSTLPVGLPAILSPAMRGAAPPTQTQPPTSPAEVPKIAPGHPLSDVTVTPAPGSDRFGTFKPEKHP
jgi:hypothetical protein